MYLSGLSLQKGGKKSEGVSGRKTILEFKGIDLSPIFNKKQKGLRESFKLGLLFKTSPALNKVGFSSLGRRKINGVVGFSFMISLKYSCKKGLTQVLGGKR